MENMSAIAKLPEALLPWYQACKRDLPWRHDQKPYHIWVSEIMLQQTRVEAVKGYYTRFLNALPDIADLANCPDEQLYKLWEGLGYYSRVRNLKKAAQQIVNQYGGVFPGEYAKILALPGIGPYTAGAICSIAFQRPTPAVDGNVLRVISRITNDATPIDQPSFKQMVHHALEKIYPAQAGDFTQALMELGATVCGPNREPECQACPCKEFCLAYRENNAKNLPVKSPKKQRKMEERTVFLFSCEGKYALQKRDDAGLLRGMWQFPNVPGKLSVQDALDQVEKFGLKTKEIAMQVEKKHIFTHIEWDMCGIYIETEACNDTFVWMTPEEINTQAALPTAFRIFWDVLNG